MSLLPSTYIEGFHYRDKVLKMRYNPLGKTGLLVSHISLGGGAFSNFYNEFNEDEAIETVIEAVKCGINFIDTAPWYGQGRSETLIGKALKRIPREAYYIATKVGRYETDYKNMFNFTSEKTQASFDDSLNKLGLDYVDIIQVHDVEFAPKLDIIVKETLPCLLKQKSDGKAKFIGITGYPLATLRDLADLSDIKLDTVLTYCRNTLIDSSLNDYVEFFERKNMGIIDAACVAMGLLTNSGPMDWHPASEFTKLTCQTAAKYCQTNNVELGKLALWYGIKNPYAATHLVGMNNKQLLHANLSVLHNGLTEKEHQVLEHINNEYLSEIEDCNWEGIEVEKYRDYMKSAS